MAASLAKSGDTKGAEKEYKKAVESKPLDPMALVEYGKFLQSTGRKDEAKVQYEAVLKVMPDHKLAKKAMSSLAGG
ncbi:MAG: tetratricopeptide repeat protein [Cyanobacteriota/Melainabacteria group bacterium]